MKKDKILKLFYLFLIIQPLVDLITSLMTRFIDFPITLGVVVRGLISFIAIVYVLFFSKSKYKKVSIIYFCVLLIFIGCYFGTKLDLFSNFSYLFTEIMYAFKYFYTLIILFALFNFIDEYEPNNRKVFKILQFNLFFYCFIIFLANITGTAFVTYSSTRLGNNGWFFSGNEVGIIVALLFPFLYLLINKATSYKVLLYVIPITLGVELIGTKTSMLGLLLPTFVFLIYYLIRFRKGKKKQFLMTLFILFIILVTSPNLPVVQSIKNNIDRFDRRQEKTDLDDDYTDKVVTSVLLSDRDYFQKKTHKIYENASIKDKVFGLGFVNRESINNKAIEKLIEMDFYDIFYHYGILGFIIYVMPFVLLFMYILKLSIKLKFKFNMKQLTLGYISCIGLAIAALSGHTLGAPGVSLYVVLAFGMFIYYLEKGQYKINIDSNKITILALHLGTGGVEKYLSSLCRMLENDYKIELVSTYKIDNKPAFYFSNRIKIVYLINDYPHKKEFYEAVEKKNIINVFKYGVRLFKILILKYIKNIDYIENIDSKYIITTREFHNRLVSSNKNRDTIAIATEHNYHNNDKKYVKRVCDSLNNIDYLVLVSNELKEYYESRVSNTKCIYIPNVIDDIPKYRESKKINNKLISIGRLSQEKGYEDLIDIIGIIKKDIPSIHLDLYGDGPLRGKLEIKIKELKLENNIKIFGFCNHDVLFDKIKKYDLFLMTSYTESFGLVILEAMSNSLPCIGFDSANGVKHLLRDGNGILISNRNKEEYAKEVVLLLNDMGRINKLSRKGYDSIFEYGIDSVKDKWLDLLLEIDNFELE